MDVSRRVQMVPLVGQNRAVLPDGAVDPEHASDCGEACLSAVLAFFGRGFLSPGCVRQWLGKDGGSGETTAADLERLLRWVLLPASAEAPLANQLRSVLEVADTTGGLCVVLGAFVSPELNHWNVAHAAGDEGVWCMDPWLPARVHRKWDSLASLYRGVLVVVHGD